MTSSLDGKESRKVEMEVSKPIPITKTTQSSSNRTHDQDSSSAEESPSKMNRTRSISYSQSSSGSSSAWFDSNAHRNMLAARNPIHSNASKRRSLIINPLWFENQKQEYHPASLPRIDWKAKFPEFDVKTLMRPINELIIISSTSPVEDACKKLIELASDQTTSHDFLVVENGEEPSIFDHSILNRFLSLVLSPPSTRSSLSSRSRPSTPASESSNAPLQSPSIQASAWAFPVQGASDHNSTGVTEQARFTSSIAEIENEILTLAKEEKKISVSMVLALAGDQAKSSSVSSEANLSEILLLLSNGNGRLLVKERSSTEGKEELIGVLPLSSVLEFLLSNSKDPDLSEIFDRCLDELKFIQERVLEISGEKTVLEAMKALSMENYSSLAVFDSRGTMVSSINVNEISLSILRSSSKTLLSTTLSSFINRNLSSRPEGLEGKEAMPLLRLRTNATLKRALSSLLATKSFSLYVFENDDENQGLTPPPSATSSTSSFKELGFLQELNYALPSFNNSSIGSGGNTVSLSKNSGGNYWNNRPLNSQIHGHSPSSSVGSTTSSTNRSGSQNRSQSQSQLQAQHQSQNRVAVESSIGNAEFQRIPIARRSSSASCHGGGSNSGHRRQLTPSTPSSELPPLSPSKSSVNLGTSSNNSVLKGFITLQDICQIFASNSTSQEDQTR